jgi:hypothetical protein
VDPGPSSYLPSYSYGAALHHTEAQLPPAPPSLVSHLSLLIPETEISARVDSVVQLLLHRGPNIAKGNYGDPYDSKVKFISRL